MNHPFVKLAFEGAKRLASKSSVSRQKEPITTEMIKQCVAKHKNSENLMHLRFMIICIIAFTGFLLIGEMLEIKIKHISIFDDRVEILIPKSKMDQLREGHIVHIAKKETTACPQFWMLKYLKVSKLDKELESFLICRIYKTKKGHNAHSKQLLSYSRAREIFMEQLALIFPDTDVKVFGLHSLRSGGASAAVDNISDRLIGKHGRWSANRSRDRYIKDNKSKRLKVSASLNL